MFQPLRELDHNVLRFSRPSGMLIGVSRSVVNARPIGAAAMNHKVAEKINKIVQTAMLRVTSLCGTSFYESAVHTSFRSVDARLKSRELFSKCPRTCSVSYLRALFTSQRDYRDESSIFWRRDAGKRRAPPFLPRCELARSIFESTRLSSFFFSIFFFTTQFLLFNRNDVFVCG